MSAWDGKKANGQEQPPDHRREALFIARNENEACFLPRPAHPGSFFGKEKIMAKRLTDSEKWEDPWFMDLPAPMKMLWVYLLDKCNYAGIWKINKKFAEFQIGSKIEWETVLELFGNRIYTLGDYWFIPKFMIFQYGKDLNRGDAVINAIKQLKESGFMEIALRVLGDSLGRVIGGSGEGRGRGTAKATAISITSTTSTPILQHQDTTVISKGVVVDVSSAGSFPKTEVGVLKEKSISTPLKSWNEGPPREGIELQDIEELKKKLHGNG